jgi:nitrite reductase/ring-hydroxylating ferredoxin subunit
MRERRSSRTMPPSYVRRRRADSNEQPYLGQHRNVDRLDFVSKCRPSGFCFFWILFGFCFGILLDFVSDGTYYAIDDFCPHMGASLAGGCLDGNVVTCPWHGWQYDIRCGKHLVSSITLTHYPIEIRAGKVWIDLEGHPK